MKTILCILLSAFFLPAPAADVIVLNDDGTVTRNGVSLNNVWDALLNKQLSNRECADAWKAKMKELADAKAELDKAKAELDKAKADAEKVSANALTKIKALRAEKIAEREKEKVTGTGKRFQTADDQQDILGVLEGTLNVTAKDIEKAAAQERFNEAKRALEEASK